MAEPASACLGELCSLQDYLVQGAGIIRLTKLSSAASLTLYLYDYITTLDTELDIAWKAPMSLGKVIYFCSRYCCLAFLIFANVAVRAFYSYLGIITCMTKLLSHSHPHRCLSWIRVHWISGVLLSLHVERPVILQVRLYAFYGRDKLVRNLLIAAFLMVAFTLSFLAGKVISVEKASFLDFGPGSYMHMCFPENLASSYSHFFIVPILTNDTLLFILVLNKAIKNIKMYGTGRNANRLTMIFLEDTAVCFFSTFTAYLINLLMWIIGSSGYIEFPVGFTVAIGGIACQRLCLGFRKERPGIVKYTLDGPW